MTFDPVALLGYVFAVAAGAFVSWLFCDRHYARREESIRREDRAKSYRQAAAVVDVIASDLRDWARAGIPMTTAARVVRGLAEDLRGEQ